MLNLMKNEIYKIFHKKSTIIVLFIIIAYAILINFIYKTSNDGNSYYYSGYILTDEEIANYKKYITNFNQNSDSVTDYIEFQTLLDVNDMVNKFEIGSWQREIIDEKYYTVAYNYYNAKFYENDQDAIKKYEEFNEKIKNDDWKYFVNQELIEAQENVKMYQNIVNDKNTNKKELNNYKAYLFTYQVAVGSLEYRLENDLPYGTDYLNMALNAVNNAAYSTKLYELTENEKEKQNLEYEVSSFYENKYILDTKRDTNNSRTLRMTLINFFSEYYFLILVFVIMIAGGIVSDEFNKGTIKSLLTIPYSRSKVLLSKFLTILLLVPFIIIFTVIVELVVGGIVFGFSSLSIPVVSYNLSAGNLNIINIFEYVALMSIASIPKIVLLATLAFALSTIINNTAFAIALTLCGTIASEIINSFALTFNIKLLNYFVTTCWDLENYLFGGVSPFGISLPRALITCLVYFIIMIVVSFIVFKKKDIKNI